MSFRVGLGWDIHRLVENRPLILGGMAIPFPKGLQGHSDADVLLHAVCDALLGAISETDIGTHFPDTDPKYAGVSSVSLLEAVVALVARQAWRVVNLDCVVVAEAPKLAPHLQAIRAGIASVLKVNDSQVSVKGKTAEGLGSIGEGNAIAAQAVVLLGRE